MYASSSSCTFHRPGQESTYDAVLIIYIVCIEKKKYFHRWISIDSRIYENDAKKNPSILFFFPIQPSIYLHYYILNTRSMKSIQTDDVWQFSRKSFKHFNFHPFVSYLITRCAHQIEFDSCTTSTYKYISKYVFLRLQHCIHNKHFFQYPTTAISKMRISR